jgi:hypothetical protein
MLRVTQFFDTLLCRLCTHTQDTTTFKWQYAKMCPFGRGREKERWCQLLLFVLGPENPDNAQLRLHIIIFISIFLLLAHIYQPLPSPFPFASSSHKPCRQEPKTPVASRRRSAAAASPGVPRSSTGVVGARMRPWQGTSHPGT